MTAQRPETWREFAAWLRHEAGWHERRNFLMLVTVTAAVVGALVWVLAGMCLSWRSPRAGSIADAASLLTLGCSPARGVFYA